MRPVKSNSYTNSNSDTHSHAYSNSYAHTDCDTNPNSNGDTYSHANAYATSICNTQANAVTGRNSDTAAGLNRQADADIWGNGNSTSKFNTKALTSDKIQTGRQRDDVTGRDYDNRLQSDRERLPRKSLRI